MPVIVGGVDITDLSHVSHLLNAPSRRLTWLTILKASVAVALAWQIASALPGDESPVFAPIVALMTVQSSLYGTFAQGFQTVAGNIIGVALATAFVNVAGRTTLVLFVATFAGLAISKRLPIGSGARGQVTFSMILVVALGPTSGYASARLVDCAVGGAIGIIIALLIPEPPVVEPARAAIVSWTDGLRESLLEIAATLSIADAPVVPAGDQHPFVDVMLGRLRAADETLTSAVAGAIESIRFNPRGRRRAKQVQELADALSWFRRLSLQVQTIALDVDALYDRPTLEPRLDRGILSRLLLAVSKLVPTGTTLGEQSAAGDLRQALRQALGETTEDDDSVAIVLDSVTLLGRLDHLVLELTNPSAVPAAMKRATSNDTPGRPISI